MRHAHGTAAPNRARGAVQPRASSGACIRTGARSLAHASGRVRRRGGSGAPRAAARRRRRHGVREALHSQPFSFVTTRPPQLSAIRRTSLSLKISVLAYDASRPAVMTAVECASAPTRPAPDGRGRGLAGAARGTRLPRSVPRPRPSLSEKYARGTLKGSSCRPPHRRSAAGVLT